MMTDEDFLQAAVARCEEGGGSAAFTEQEIGRLVALSGVDGIDYVADGSGSHALSERLVRWLFELANQGA